MMTSQLRANWRRKAEKAADESNEQYEAVHGEEESTENPRVNDDSAAVPIQKWVKMMKTVQTTVKEKRLLAEENRKVMEALQKAVR